MELCDTGDSIRNIHFICMALVWRNTWTGEADLGLWGVSRYNGGIVQRVHCIRQQAGVTRWTDTKIELLCKYSCWGMGLCQGGLDDVNE